MTISNHHQPKQLKVAGGFQLVTWRNNCDTLSSTRGSRGGRIQYRGLPSGDSRRVCHRRQNLKVAQLEVGDYQIIYMMKSGECQVRPRVQAPEKKKVPEVLREVWSCAQLLAKAFDKYYELHHNDKRAHKIMNELKLLWRPHLSGWIVYWVTSFPWKQYHSTWDGMEKLLALL